MIDENVFIEGFGLSDYASFNELQYIGPFKKMNIIAGQNNSGKSNIIRYLYEAINENIKNLKVQKGIPKRNPHQKTYKVETDKAFSLGINKHYLIKKALLTVNDEEEKSAHEQSHHHILKHLEKNGLVWLDFSYDGSFSKSVKNDILSNKTNINHWLRLYRHFFPRTGINTNDISNHYAPQLLQNYAQFIPEFKAEMIPCFRKVENIIQSGESTSFETHFNGKLLVKRLAHLQNPAISELFKAEQFKKINRFLQSITGDTQASINIPASHDTIHVHLNNRTLTIDQLGTGIQEIIIIAAAATVLEYSVICLEEPELHLHPAFQRKLIRYLQENTNNQYFITTHSAHILDTPDAEIFHVELKDNESVVSRVTEDIDKFYICKDLGYRASDLIQTNSIIWVEGPSDRIYLNYWIKSLNPELVEGLHYSIMFYGGRLLSHLSPTDKEIGDFIALNRLNQNVCIIIDSDRDKAGKPINKTKQRIRNNIAADSHNFVWITQGREIENYLPPEILQKTLKDLYEGTCKIPSTLSAYDNCLKLQKKRKKDFITADKVQIARTMVAQEPHMGILDLRTQAQKLVRFIENANS